MSFFRKLRKLIPIFTFKDTDSCPYPTIVSNVAETLYSGISHEDFLKHMMGKTPCEIPFTMSLIPISKEDRDRCQKMNGIVKWLTYKPIFLDEFSTPLDIVTDFNTSDDEFLDTNNDKCFPQSSKKTLNTSVCSKKSFRY